MDSDGPRALMVAVPPCLYCGSLDWHRSETRDVATCGGCGHVLTSGNLCEAMDHYRKAADLLLQKTNKGD